jgi:hypothetical protein
VSQTDAIFIALALGFVVYVIGNGKAQAYATLLFSQPQKVGAATQQTPGQILPPTSLPGIGTNLWQFIFPNHAN